MVRCEECRCVASDADEAWVTYLHADNEELLGEEWSFVSYCPSCAFRVFTIIPREACI
jgi:hypothetical protein